MVEIRDSSEGMYYDKPEYFQDELKVVNFVLQYFVLRKYEKSI